MCTTKKVNYHNNLFTLGTFFFLLVLFFTLVWTFQEVLAKGSIFYVEPEAIGLGDCSSWDNSCNLQTAISQTVSGDQIWVAAGTYYPSDTGNPNKYFQLKNGVVWYGGFDPSAGEAGWEDRDWVENSTILSGDLVSLGYMENSRHVFMHSVGLNLDSSAVLDGFRIVKGVAGSLIGEANYGGGMYNYYSSPSLINIIFDNNEATGDGGGMYNYYSSPTLVNVTFSENRALYTPRGGIGRGGGCLISSPPRQ